MDCVFSNLFVLFYFKLEMLSAVFWKVNAEKVAVTGKKRSQKLYRRHSGRPGGMKVETFAQLQERIPERIVEHAVRGMLPKGRVTCYFSLAMANSFDF